MPLAKATRGPKSTEWALEPHSKAKHDLVQKYLGGWFPILGRFNGRIVFLDGFAGPGTYATGEMGSPLLAIETLLDHPMFGRFGTTEFVFLFFEPESDRATRLRERLAEFAAARGGLPTNVKWTVYELTFADGAASMTEYLEQQKARLAPTFAFIDPFGFSGVPLALISRLLNFEKCEVFFNFMYDFINRFATAGNVDSHLEEIYGTNEYLRAADYASADERREFLLDLYARQLREVADFPYVSRFDMYNRQGHNTYSLFHGTRSLTGLKLMKQAMWSVDPESGKRFSDRLVGTLPFDIRPDLTPLRKMILERFAGEVVTVEQIEEFTLVETDYSASHYNRGVLAPLEREGQIEVVSSSRKRRQTFPDGTTIRFPGSGDRRT
jgi:three-Cys-motif partner protein